MKVKTACRIVGTFQTGAFISAGYILSNNEYNKLVNVFSAGYPIEYKLESIAYLGALTVCSIGTALGITDGVVDVVKGTHHYFGLQVWKKLSRKQETKEKIDKSQQNMLERIEKKI